jgi:hypothetical protein
MKAVDKANDNSREKAIKQQTTRLPLSNVGSKPTGRASRLAEQRKKLRLLSREEGDEDTDSFRLRRIPGFTPRLVLSILDKG